MLRNPQCISEEEEESNMAVIESVRQRQKNATDFNLCYENLCALQNSCPLGPVKANLDENTIDCNADRIRVADWLPILNSLRINKSLKCIAFRSYWQQTLYPDGEISEQRLQALKKKAPAIRSKDLTHRMCRALKECLYVTDSLNSLILQGIPLRERDLHCLAKGIMKNRSLQHLSLEFCQIGDHGVEVLCNAIKNSLSITSVNFTGCGLTWKGAESLAKVIKHQATRRHSVAWMDSLRYRRPDLDRMPGLRRITICKNPLINDRGAEFFAEALKDDLWLKALDMQQCGISTEGAQAFKSVLTYNTAIAILDLRLNHLIDRDVMTSLMEQIMINTGESDSGFPWLVITTPKPGRIRPTKKTGRQRVTSAVGGRRSASASGSRPRTAPTKSAPRRAVAKSSGGFVPWRTAARVGQNRHKLVKQSDEPAPTKKRKPPSLGRAKATSSPLPSEEDGHASGGEDSSSEGSQTREKLRDLTFELEMLKQRLVEESRARASSDSRILELQVENRRLQQEVRLLRTRQQFPASSIVAPIVRTARLSAEEPQSDGVGHKKTVLEDDRVLESIEASFKQFHAFLDLLKGTGFGDLARLLGENGRLQEHDQRLGPTTT